jgi:hypothetical protein
MLTLLTLGQKNLFLNACDEGVYEILDHELVQFLLAFVVIHHVDGNKSMKHGPEGMQFQEGVGGFVVAGGDQFFYRLGQGIGKEAHFGDLVHGFAGRHSEAIHHLVMGFVIEGEFPVSVGHCFDLFLRQIGSFSCFLQFLVEELKTLFGKFQEDSFFALEVIINHGYAVFYRFGDLADGECLPSFVGHDLPGGLKYGASHFFSLPYFPFSYSHFKLI